MTSIIANDNAIGQYYIEVKETDFALETACELIGLEHAPVMEWGNEIPPGTYLVGRDIQPGRYQGQAGQDIMESCYWARLRDVSGEFAPSSRTTTPSGSTSSRSRLTTLP